MTYMLTGKFNHEDFAGHRGTIGPGDLQWMTAGRGIVHAEMPASQERAHGLQLWINLPRSEKMCEPRYQELLDRDIPRFDDGEGVEVKVIAGESHGIKSPVYTKTPTYYLDFKLAENKRVEQSIPEGWNAFVYVLGGSAYVEGKKMDAHNTVVLSNEKSETGLIVETKDETCHFVLIAGKPLGEPVVQHGPFVMTSKEEIAQTFMDYQKGENGFERALHWESKIGKVRQ